MSRAPERFQPADRQQTTGSGHRLLTCLLCVSAVLTAALPLRSAEEEPKQLTAGVRSVGSAATAATM